MAEKILIVDDDPDTIRLLSLMLVNLGYQVVVARNGIEALEQAHKELPDLIILDIMLPGADGFEVAQSLHRMPDTAVIPILMVTARSATEDKVRGYEVGADIYLTKPVQRMDLQANIKVLLLQRRARKAAAAQQGYVVGVMAAKGGLGCSTIALNLAVAYAKKFQEKVVAAEMQPGCGTWADELNLPLSFGLAELLKLAPEQISAPVADGQLTITDYGVKLLLASNLSREPIYPQSANHYECIVNALASTAKLTLLDIGTFFSPFVPNIIGLCNEVVVVTEPQLLPVKQTGRMLDLLRTYGVGSSRPLTVVSLNHTRSDVSLTISQIEEYLKRPVSLGIPPAMELSAHAIRQGLPMVAAQPDSLFGQQIGKLVESIHQHVK